MSKPFLYRVKLPGSSYRNTFYASFYEDFLFENQIKSLNLQN